MEAGACAAGDRYEQEREQGLARSIDESGERRDLDLGSAGEGSADDGDQSDDHHTVEQEGAQVVTRLQQDPYRKQ